MVSPNPRRDAGLEEAFGVFSQVSEQLASSYQALEARVAQLTDELAQARSERVQEQGKNGRLTNRIEHLLSALPAGVVVLDGHGRVQECNPAAEVLGKAVRPDRHHRARLHAARARRPRFLRDGRPVGVATRSLDPEPGQIILITIHLHAPVANSCASPAPVIAGRDGSEPRAPGAYAAGHRAALCLHLNRPRWKKGTSAAEKFFRACVI